MQVEINKTLTGNKESIYAMSADPLDDAYFYTGAANGWAVAWNINDTKEGKMLAQFPAGIFALYAFVFEDRKILAIGLNTGGFYLIDVQTQKIVHQERFAEAVFAFCKLENQLWVGGEKGLLLQFDLTKNEVISKKIICEKNVRKLMSYSQGLVACLSDGHLWFYDPEKQATSTLFTHERGVFSLLFLENEQKLVTGGMDAHMKVWEKKEESYHLLLSIPAHLFTVYDLKLSPCGRYMASCSRDKHIKIWDTDTFQVVKVLDKDKYSGAHTHSVNALYWQKDCLVSIGDDRRIILWKIQD